MLMNPGPAIVDLIARGPNSAAARRPAPARLRADSASTLARCWSATLRREVAVLRAASGASSSIESRRARAQRRLPIAFFRRCRRSGIAASSAACAVNGSLPAADKRRIIPRARRQREPERIDIEREANAPAGSASMACAPSRRESAASRRARSRARAPARARSPARRGKQRGHRRETTSTRGSPARAATAAARRSPRPGKHRPRRGAALPR